MSSNTNSPSTAQMVGLYSKLFTWLSIITLAGIAAVYFFHMPLWLVMSIGFLLMAIKSTLVVELFKQFMVGRNLILMIFALTISVIIGLLILPVLNHGGQIVGTEDTSMQIQMETKQEPVHHGN